MTAPNDIYTKIAPDLDDPAKTAEDSTDLLPWMNDCIQLIRNRLFHQGSDLVLERESLTYSTDDQNKDLPSGFEALKGLPWIDGTTTFLNPLPDRTTALSFTTSGTPKYYELWDDDMYIYPPTNASRTIKFDCMKEFTLLTAADETIPLKRIFDDALGKYIIQRYKTSLIHADEYNNMIPGGVGEKNPFWVALIEAEWVAFNRGGTRSRMPIMRRGYVG